jgi:hypothetical protein
MFDPERGRSRSEPRHDPPIAFAVVAKAIVKPMLAFVPDLDAPWDEAVAAPVGRARDVAARETLPRLRYERVEGLA